MGNLKEQAVAYGAQDLYLTGTPEVTWWKAVHKRHSNFAKEAVQQTFNGSVGLGKRVTCTLSRNGDLVSNIWLEFDIDTTIDASWYPAEALVKEIELEIGGQKIDRHYSDWFRLYDELFHTAEQKAAYRNMTNVDWDEENGTAGLRRKLYLPLNFFFNKDAGMALPLISLQFHEVKLHITFADSVVGVNALQDVKLYADFVYLDVEERKKFASASHEYLIEQLQFTGDEGHTILTTGTTTKQIRLSFNHPVKYIVWAMKDGSKHGIYNLATDLAKVLTPLAGGVVPKGYYNDSFAPLHSAKLQLNGHDRFSERPGSYFSKVQPMQHCGTQPQAGVYFYSFALDPKKTTQPTGSCNFSRIDNATLSLTFKKHVDGLVSTVADAADEFTGDATILDNFKTIKVFCSNWNVLRIMSGMGGLAFSN